MELVSITSELMPKGEPNLTGVIQYPTVERLRQEVGEKVALLSILVLVRDFCNSVNAVRNMNEDQIIETASILLDECGNFRLEDYVMMFALGKRGQLVKIYDRVDVSLVSEMLDVYWGMRDKAGQRAQETQYHEFEDQLKEFERKPAQINEQEQEMQGKIISQMKDLGEQMKENFKEDKAQEEIRRDHRIKQMQNNIYGNLTPEMQQEMDELRKRSRKGWIQVDQPRDPETNLQG